MEAKKGIKKANGGVIAIVTLGVLLLGLIGYMTLEKTVWKTECATCSSANPETGETSEVEHIDVEKFEADKLLLSDGILHLDGVEDEIVNDINGRYPEYHDVSEVAWMFGDLIVNDKSVTGASLVEDLGGIGNSAGFAYLFGSLFSTYTSIRAELVDAKMTALFGVQNPRELLASKGITYTDQSYTVPSSGIGGAYFPVAFLTGISRSCDETVLTYDYARAQFDESDVYKYYEVVNKLQFTLSRTGQILMAEVIE